MSGFCAACGAQVEQNEATEPMAGPPDFDTRPSNASLETWVHRCGSCGYCSADLTHIHKTGAEVVRSPHYQAVLLDDGLPEKTREFWCYSQILEHASLFADAGWSCLHAAWACDDDNHNQAAIRCRLRALDLWKQGKQLGQSFADDLPSEFALAADVYRRAGQFERAVVTCAEALDTEDLSAILGAILRREKTLAENRDDSRHSLAEVRLQSR